MEFAPDFEPDFAFPPDFTAVKSSRGLTIVRPSTKILAELQAITEFFFCRSVSNYAEMSDSEYHELVLKAQAAICARKIEEQLSQDCQLVLSQILNAGRLVFQPLRLRAARPWRLQQHQEVVSWHRERFYNIAGDHMINFWVPIANVNASTALQYLPDSHLIPHEALKVESTRDPRVSKTAQGVGFVEDIKHIVGGVDLSKAEPMVVLPGEAVVFHGAMIHGMGENHSDKIRFSIDFRIFSSYNAEVLTEKLRLIGERNKKPALAGVA